MIHIFSLLMVRTYIISASSS